MPAKPSSTRDRFERLLKAIRSGRCVPFLGAGVSWSATVPDPREELGTRLHGWSMTNKLAIQVLIDCQEDPDWAQQVRELCKTLVLPKDPLAPTPTLTRVERNQEPAAQVESLKEKLPPPLATLSELVALRRGYSHLCEVLHIAQLCELKPAPAHHAIAQLLRERAFAEVITTNYDTCLEQAYGEALQVITTAHAYMSSHTPYGAPQPRLYKINGCANEYRSAPQEEREQAARRIILTERQLQTFRGERWAEEMFRDRARHQHLLFSGFGSEEPQIRHTALAVAEEFAAYGQRSQATRPPGSPWDHGAAPWLQVFGTQLSFYQLQVVEGWRQAWEAEPHIDLTADHTNVLSGGDHTFFRSQTAEQLTADDFWTGLLHGWWRAEMLEELRRGQLGTSLRREGLDPSLLEELVDRLLDDDGVRVPRLRLVGRTSDLEKDDTNPLRPLLRRLTPEHHSLAAARTEVTLALLVLQASCVDWSVDLAIYEPPTPERGALVLHRNGAHAQDLLRLPLSVEPLRTTSSPVLTAFDWLCTWLRRIQSPGEMPASQWSSSQLRIRGQASQRPGWRTSCRRDG